MRTLGHVVFFLLLGSICCKNNRNAKFGGKSPKKSGRNQGAGVSQSPLFDAAAGSTGRGSRGLAEAGRDNAGAARTAGQQTDDMRLYFLKNNQVTCNDGTAAGWDAPDPIFYFTHKYAHGINGFPLLLIYGSTGFTWRSQKEVAGGCYFWKVRIVILPLWLGLLMSSGFGMRTGMGVFGGFGRKLFLCFCLYHYTTVILACEHCLRPLFWDLYDLLKSDIWLIWPAQIQNASSVSSYVSLLWY